MLDGPMISLEDGVLLRPKVVERGAETIPLASGSTIPADHYNLSGAFNVDVWYDRTDTWASLALRLSRTAPTSITSGCEQSVTLDGFLIAHGSALILPLAVIEGPVVTILTGFLSAQGYFDWYWALCLLVCGDLIGDLIYYWIGRTGRTPLAGLGRRLGAAPRRARPSCNDGLTHNAAKMLFIGKWTHSIGWLVLIGSGMLRLPLPRFMLVNLLATIPKSAVLFGVGYFAGDCYPLFEQHIRAGNDRAVRRGRWRPSC